MLSLFDGSCLPFYALGSSVPDWYNEKIVTKCPEMIAWAWKRPIWAVTRQVEAVGPSNAPPQYFHFAHLSHSTTWNRALPHRAFVQRLIWNWNSLETSTCMSILSMSIAANAYIFRHFQISVPESVWLYSMLHQPAQFGWIKGTNGRWNEVKCWTRGLCHRRTTIERGNCTVLGLQYRRPSPY